jgi:hypothetical protein
MDCTDAYREALIRDFSARASSAPPSASASAPTSTSAPSRRRAAEAGREGAAGRPAERHTDPEQHDLESCGAGARSSEAGALHLLGEVSLATGDQLRGSV